VEDPDAQVLELPVSKGTGFVLSQEEFDRARQALAEDDGEMSPPKSILRKANETKIYTSPAGNEILLPSESVMPPGNELLLPQIGEVAPAKTIPAPIPGLPPTIAVEPAKQSVLVVDTSPEAMLGEGLQPVTPVMATSRPLRRSSNVGNLSVNQEGGSYSGGSSTGPITVRKLGAE